VHFTVAYRASSTCSSVGSFEAEVQRRLPHAVTESGDAPFHFVVGVFPDEHRFVGELLLREASGRETTRRVSGASCDEVVSALALVATLLVESSESATTTATPGPLPPPIPRATRVSLPARTSEQTSRRQRWRFGVGVLYHAAVGPSPRSGVEWLGGAMLPWGRQQEMLLELSFQSTLEQVQATPGGTGSFDWRSLSLLACPLRWPTAGTLALRPCALAELGDLVGIGLDTQNAAEQRMLWVAPGAALRLELVLWGPLRVELGLGGVVPLVRDSFYFEPRTDENVAFRVPSWGARGELLLTARL
jgi:hypothetical protein